MVCLDYALIPRGSLRGRAFIYGSCTWHSALHYVIDVAHFGASTFVDVTINTLLLTCTAYIYQPRCNNFGKFLITHTNQHKSLILYSFAKIFDDFLS
jgi:hypothetical protein